MDKILIIIPTYNEALNIKNLITKISIHQKNSDILIIDDNSPDGNSVKVFKLMDKYNSLKPITRTAKLGISSTHKDIIN